MPTGGRSGSGGRERFPARRDDDDSDLDGDTTISPETLDEIALDRLIAPEPQPTRRTAPRGVRPLDATTALSDATVLSEPTPAPAPAPVAPPPAKRGGLSPADTAPLFRPDLAMTQTAAGCVVRHPSTGEGFELNDFEVSLVRMFNGRRPIGEILENASRLGIPTNLESLESFIAHLERLGFLAEAPDDGKAWPSRGQWGSNVRTMFQSGIRLMRTGKHEQAASYFEAILEQDPDNEEARELLEMTRTANARPPALHAPAQPPLPYAPTGVAPAQPPYGAPPAQHYSSVPVVQVPEPYGSPSGLVSAPHFYSEQMPAQHQPSDQSQPYQYGAPSGVYGSASGLYGSAGFTPSQPHGGPSHRPSQPLYPPGMHPGMQPGMQPGAGAYPMAHGPSAAPQARMPPEQHTSRLSRKRLLANRPLLIGAAAVIVVCAGLGGYFITRGPAKPSGDTKQPQVASNDKLPTVMPEAKPDAGAAPKQPINVGSATPAGSGSAGAGSARAGSAADDDAGDGSADAGDGSADAGDGSAVDDEPAKPDEKPTKGDAIPVKATSAGDIGKVFLLKARAVKKGEKLFEIVRVTKDAAKAAKLTARIAELEKVVNKDYGDFVPASVIEATNQLDRARKDLRGTVNVVRSFVTAPKAGRAVPKVKRGAFVKVGSVLAEITP